MIQRLTTNSLMLLTNLRERLPEAHGFLTDDLCYATAFSLRKRGMVIGSKGSLELTPSGETAINEHHKRATKGH